MVSKKSPSKELTLSQVIQGFIIQRRVRLSANTLADYQNTFKKLQNHLGADTIFRTITADDIAEFLDDLAHTPRAPNSPIARAAQVLSGKTLLNIHTGLSALWTWAVAEGLAEEHIIRHVPAPKAEERVIVPFSKDDFAALLKATKASQSYQRNGKTMSNARPSAHRDEAILRLLIDTGMRASELCTLTFRDLDMDNHRVKVYGKGAKERILPFGDRTAKALWRYRAHLTHDLPSDFIFTVSDSDKKPLERRVLARLLKRLGERAGVPDCHPHRFRHTFATNFLRNGGDIYTLKAMLGHTSLDMVMHYLSIIQADVENVHRRASPVDNWGI